MSSSWSAASSHLRATSLQLRLMNSSSSRLCATGSRLPARGLDLCRMSRMRWTGESLGPLLEKAPELPEAAHPPSLLCGDDYTCGTLDGQGASMAPMVERWIQRNLNDSHSSLGEGFWLGDYQRSRPQGAWHDERAAFLRLWRIVDRVYHADVGRKTPQVLAE